MGLNERNSLPTSYFKGNIECRSEHVRPSCLPSSETSTRSDGPSIVPCYNGKSIHIHEDLVVNGLSAISIKHHKGNCKDEKRSSEGSNDSKRNTVNNLEKDEKKLSGVHYREFSKTTTDVPDCLKDKMKVDQSESRNLPPKISFYDWSILGGSYSQRRNSFWNIHRPELSKLTWPENFVSSTIVQDFFHNHLRIHGTFCEPLHEFSNRSLQVDEEFQNYSKLREIVPPRVIPPDEKVINIMEKSRSVQLNDEDLDPETMVHKSRAEFCVTIGEYIRRPPLKRTTSQQIPKCFVQPACRYESLPVQHEGLLSKETMISEEKVFTVIGSAGIILSGNGADAQRLVATSMPSLNNQQMNIEGTEDSGDPARMRTILSPRDEINDESGSSRYKL